MGTPTDELKLEAEKLGPSQGGNTPPQKGGVRSKESMAIEWYRAKAKFLQSRNATSPSKPIKSIPKEVITKAVDWWANQIKYSHLKNAIDFDNMEVPRSSLMTSISLTRRWEKKDDEKLEIFKQELTKRLIEESNRTEVIALWTEYDPRDILQEICSANQEIRSLANYRFPFHTNMQIDADGIKVNYMPLEEYNLSIGEKFAKFALQLAKTRLESQQEQAMPSPDLNSASSTVLGFIKPKSVPPDTITPASSPVSEDEFNTAPVQIVDTEAEQDSEKNKKQRVK